MLKENSGSSAWLSLDEAGALLSTSPRLLRRWLRVGLLQPKYVGRKTYVRVSDVQALSELRHTSLDMPTAIRIAQQALATSRRVSEEMREMREMLGLERKPLEVSPEAVLALVTLAERVLAGGAARGEAELRVWAHRFFSIDEAYLASVALFVATDEPWKVFLDLGAKLRQDSARCETNDRVFFDAARNHLRQVAYFYCRSQGGLHHARQLFGDSVRQRIVRAAEALQGPKTTPRRRRRQP